MRGGEQLSSAASAQVTYPGRTQWGRGRREKRAKWWIVVVVCGCGWSDVKPRRLGMPDNGPKKSSVLRYGNDLGEEDTDNGPVLRQISYREGRGRAGRGKREGRGKRCAKDGVVAAAAEEEEVMEEPDDIHRDSAWHLLGVHVRRDYPSDKWFDVVSLCLWRRLPSRSVRILRSTE
jgi:hypothetical protein